MALPQLTDTDRTEALARALAVRRERSEVRSRLKDGRVTLAEVLGSEGDMIGRIRVRQLLESLPGVGTARAAQALAELHIADNRRVQGLGTRQREQLLERFPS
ncbi:integration host factor, actinobacterial type [Streptacidiphilus sp. N1-12]|uniref:Integration host factor, actinobacterial type n=2 Tax=Streptacidiphilus alkalitolerans TaxID=3342712 RepID=A0ABV6W928_9ACTN